MTPEEDDKLRATLQEVISRANEADRPRIRALELARMAHPGYHGRQPGLPLGKWKVDGPPGIPDAGKRCVGCEMESQNLDLDIHCKVHGAVEINS